MTAPSSASSTPFTMEKASALLAQLMVRFKNTDWSSMAPLTGRVATGVAVGTGASSLVLGTQPALALYTLAIGLFMASYELPTVYASVKQCADVQVYALEKLFLKRIEVRGCAYCGCALVCLSGSSLLSAAAGLALLCSGAVHLFAHANATMLRDHTLLPSSDTAADADHDNPNRQLGTF